MKIIIDSRMRKKEKEYLSKLGELIEILPQNSVYDEISGHPDIFFCKLNNTLFRAPNLKMELGALGNEKVGAKYPEDVKYNVCQIGNFVVHNFNLTDTKILEFINKNGLEKIQVNQGYSNCSICTISNNACITSDVKVYEALKSRNIDCLLLEEDNIRLLDRNGLKSNMKGFIGGATCKINDKFILFGDSNYLKNKSELLKFLNSYNLELIDFKGLEIYDYGGVMVEEKKILECKNLRKNFGKKEILKNVSLEAEAGDIVGFIGPNGAGKTTTIKLILGLQKITSGTVKVNGYSIQNEFTQAIKKVGTIVENPDLYMYMSGYDNLKMIANLYDGITKERIDEVVKLVGLDNRIKDKVSKYSLGMRQRLGIAQAIIHKPNLLVLDEPTNGLDPEGIKQVRDLLVKLAKEEKMAILISSHNLLELESFCTKIVMIKNGEIVENTTIEEAKHTTGNMSYIFEIEDTENVIRILEEKSRVLNDSEIEVDVSKEKIPEIIEKMVKNNIKIYSVYQKENNLEEAFLKKIGGNTID